MARKSLLDADHLTASRVSHIFPSVYLHLHLHLCLHVHWALIPDIYLFGGCSDTGAVSISGSARPFSRLEGALGDVHTGCTDARPIRAREHRWNLGTV